MLLIHCVVYVIIAPAVERLSIICARIMCLLFLCSWITIVYLSCLMSSLNDFLIPYYFIIVCTWSVAKRCIILFPFTVVSVTKLGKLSYCVSISHFCSSFHILPATSPPGLSSWLLLYNSNILILQINDVVIYRWYTLVCLLTKSCSYELSRIS